MNGTVLPTLTPAGVQSLVEIVAASESATEHYESALHHLGRAVAALRNVTLADDTARDELFNAIAAVSEIGMRLEHIADEAASVRGAP